MPALIESSSENRRPRRRSFTQQLQRVFHIDKAGDARKSSSYDDPFNADIVTSTAYPPNPTVRRVGNKGSFDYSNYGPSDINSTGNSRHSSLNSKSTGLKTSESRHFSLQSFHLGPQQPAKDSPVVDGGLQKHDIDKSPTASHSIVQKKDRRATKRLEAERLELEKRLLKIEAAERDGDVSVLRRESRKLTKKQPLGGSSRSSSASGDESISRPPSRLSSIFSSSRRRSRSRSSSVDGVDDTQLTGREEVASHDNPNALPALSPTLPERLSTAISKELATKQNVLLASPEQSSQSLKLSQLKTATESTYGSSSQPTIRATGEVTYYATGAIPSDSIHQADHLESAIPEGKHVHRQADLDRALFTASLSSKKRSSAPAEPEPTKVVQTSSRNVKSELETQPLADDHIEKNLKYCSTEAIRGTAPKGLLSRASTEGVVQRYQKKFKPSPLAESHTINGDYVPSAPKRATTLARLQDSQTPTAADKATRSELGVTSSSVLQTSNGNEPGKRTINTTTGIVVKPSVMEARYARTHMSRIPTSKSSQLAPSALLTKPRFYKSLNKVTGPSGGEPTAISILSPPRRERDPSPSVPPKSPKRNSRTLCQSPDKLDGRPRPGSSLSVGMSQDSGSDYNTADEAASVISRNSGDGDVPATTLRPVDSTRAISKKGVLDPDSALVPAASAFKADSKKAAKKTRQTGHDQLVAKLFVICCRCKFWHDMPSEVYASLTLADPLSATIDQELAAWEHNALSDRLTASTAEAHPLRESPTKRPKSETQQRSLRTRITTDLPSGPVKCCWCEHHMSKQCCQGWTTVVQMRQRHH